MAADLREILEEMIAEAEEFSTGEYAEAYGAVRGSRGAAKVAEGRSAICFCRWHRERRSGRKSARTAASAGTKMPRSNDAVSLPSALLPSAACRAPLPASTRGQNEEQAESLRVKEEDRFSLSSPSFRFSCE